MNTIDSMVKTLAAGALARPDAGPALLDAYVQVKSLLETRYGIDLDGLEKRPDSAARQAVVVEELTDVNAAGDAELLDALDELAAVLAGNQAAQAASQVIGVDLADVRAQFLNVSNVASTGCGVVVDGATIEGGIEISGVHAGYTKPPASSPQDQPLPKESTQPSIRLLFLAANPSDQARLNLAEESRCIDRSLRMTEYRDRFDLQVHFAVRAGDLQELLLRHKPQIVHFSGHGSPENELIFQDDQGDSHAVSAETLADLFGLLKDNIGCVVLNACYAEGQANAIAEHIHCVVGMADAIGDDAAIAFSTAFYRALGYGRDVSNAFQLAVNAIASENLPDVDVPVLIAAKDPATVRFVA